MVVGKGWARQGPETAADASVEVRVEGAVQSETPNSRQYPQALEGIMSGAL
jgi:hypothetical protein